MIHTACHYPFAPSAKRQTTSTKANLTLQFPQTPKNKKASPCGASLLLSHALLVRGVGLSVFTSSPYLTVKACLLWGRLGNHVITVYDAT